MSSLLRPALVNTTNAATFVTNQLEDDTLLALPERKRQLLITAEKSPAPKRARILLDEVVNDKSSGDEDSEDEDAAPVFSRKPRTLSAFDIMNARMGMRPGGVSRLPSLPTRPILESLVSSNKSDVLKLHSTQNTSYMSPPYACSYSHSSKRGESSLLAVTTEEGVVHILDTSKRREWDSEPQRSTFQPHENGVFDVQWSRDDTQLATVSADRSLCISTISQSDITPTIRLRHHTSTVKCVAWDPSRDGDILCSGSRDGTICVWDLRLRQNPDDTECKPAMEIPKSHDTKKASPRKGKVTAPPARGVTGLLLSERDRNSLISSGSYDGFLRQWDLRYLDVKRRSTRQEPTIKRVASPASISSDDPTLYRGTRRARGITSITPGSGVTAGLLFALSNDSRIHTYDMATLEPLSGWTTDPSSDRWSYGHENMRTNSFYVRLAMSPCGRWLASGGQKDGCAYVFDVSSATRARMQPSLYTDMRGDGVELCGQKGEVGAVDWSPGSLATCADDGTVRVWRPDSETHSECEAEPESMQWNWAWARERR